MQTSINGIVVSVLLGMQKDSLVTAPVDQVEATFEGFPGDRHAGLTRPSDSRTPHYPRGTPIRNDRQISIISVEEMAEVAARMYLPEIRPEWLGANLLLEGIQALTRLPPATRMFFQQGAVLYISGENNPCIHPGKVIQAAYPQRAELAATFTRAAAHLRGLVAVVEKPGIIARGDSVSVKIPAQYRYNAD
jgi:hypothetical protein